MKTRRRFLALGTAGALGLAGVLTWAVPSGAQSLPGTAAAPVTAKAPPLPQGAVRLGALPAGSGLHLDVTLKVRDPAALSAFLAAVADPRSPLFHQFLRRGQFGPRFGPTLAAVAAVRAALQRAGLSPGPVSSDRLAIPVTASAAAAERAFGIALLRYRLASGRIAFANTSAPRIPAAAAPYVSGVLGLNDLYRVQSMIARPAHAAGRAGLAAGLAVQPSASGPKPCTSAIINGAPGLTANVFAARYRMAPLYKLGDLGQKIHVGIFELEPNLTGDISTYEKCYGISTKVTYTKVDGGSGSGPGSGEAALDIEDVAGLAPAATINVYQGPNGTDQNIYDTYHKMVKDDLDNVITTSWGLCDLDLAANDQPMITAEQTVFAQADAQGQTVFAAAGDSGSTGCLPDSGSPNQFSLSAGDPSSQPFVNGVGGTKFTRTGERVWNESALNEGAGGGGVSQDWCMPGYQFKTLIPGLISSHSVKDGACAAAQQHYVRQTPDVSADADPETGYVVRWDNSWLDIGGTSAAAPLWAAAAALIDASPFCADYGSGHAGVLPQVLYRTVSKYRKYIYAARAEGLRDVTLGNNDYTPSGYTGGLYPSTKGYDMASGLGTPIITGVGPRGSSSMYEPGLAALMCRALARKLIKVKVTGLSSHKGSVRGGQKVTVFGRNFLPIAGADMAKVGTTWVRAACPSTTRCVIRMPRHRAGTVDIRISAETFTLSAITRADRYKYT